jgi:plasmid stabilization system protein ParE
VRAKVVITSDAWRDLAGIVEHIAKDNPAAAEQFGNKLVDTAHALGIAPFSGCRLKGFPGVRTTVHGKYLVIYKVEPERRRLLVLRFWHSARDLKRLRLRV